MAHRKVPAVIVAELEDNVTLEPSDPSALVYLVCHPGASLRLNNFRPVGGRDQHARHFAMAVSPGGKKKKLVRIP
jgi:hypothetical protein